MAAKTEHLKMIQRVIDRMASNSFQLKRWNVVLISTLFALASTDAGRTVVYVALLPAIVFWGLDGYFLWQERLFRQVYDRARLIDESSVDFSMHVDVDAGDAPTWIGATFSKALVVFHGAILATIVAVILVLRRAG